MDKKLTELLNHYDAIDVLEEAVKGMPGGAEAIGTALHDAFPDGFDDDAHPYPVKP